MSDANPLRHPLHLIRHTPILDLIRLRFTGELDWRSIIAESQLPKSLQAMLVQLIRKSKLTRSERTSVAHEMVAHFEDGHRGGSDWDELEAEFGDPNVAAQLIQRSKERNRSMWSKLFKAASLLSLFGIVVIAIWAYSFLNREATISVDYTVELNKLALAAAESDRAWPIYRDSWTKYKFVELNLDSTFSEVADTVFAELRPGDEAWPEVEQYLDDHKDLLDALRAGSQKPAFGLELKNSMDSYSDADQIALFPTWHASKPTSPANNSKHLPEAERADESSIAGVLLPHVQAMRTASHLILADSRRAMAAKDLDRAIDDIRTQFGMARQAAESACFVSALVGFSVLQDGYEIARELLTEHQDQLSDAQLKKMQSLVESLDIKTFLDPKVDRLFVDDLLQRIYTDDGNGDGRITKLGVAMISGWASGTDKDALGYGMSWKILRSSRKKIAESFDSYFEGLTEDMFKTWHEQPRTTDDLISNSFKAKSPGAFMANYICSSVNAHRDIYHRECSKRFALETTIALHRFKKATGNFPDKLETLVPDYLASVAKDPLSNRPMSFVLKNDQPLLYYWGHDGIDNKGASLQGGPNHQVTDAFGIGAKGFDGDWILWSAAKK